MLIPKFLIFYPRTSQYWPSTDGEFKVAPGFGDNYVYQGRLLTVEEFNRLPGEFWESDRYRSPLRVKCVMAEEDKVADEGDEGDGNEPATTEPATTEPATTEPATRVENIASTPRESLESHLVQLPKKADVLEFADGRGVEIDKTAKRGEIEALIVETLYPSE